MSLSPLCSFYRQIVFVYAAAAAQYKNSTSLWYGFGVKTVLKRYKNGTSGQQRQKSDRFILSPADHALLNAVFQFQILAAFPFQQSILGNAPGRFILNRGNTMLQNKNQVHVLHILSHERQIIRMYLFSTFLIIPDYSTDIILIQRYLELLHERGPLSRVELYPILCPGIFFGHLPDQVHFLLCYLRRYYAIGLFHL